MINSSEYFVYDGKRSDGFGIIGANVDSGLFNQSFMADRDIQEVEVQEKDTPLFQGYKKRPLEFPVTIYFEDGFDREKLQKVRQLFNVNFYKPMQFSEETTKIYYCMLVGSSDLNHNGIEQGYATLNFRCDSPYSFSPTFVRYFDLSTNTSGTEIELENFGDEKCYPIIKVKKVGAGFIELINNSDGGRLMRVSNLADAEEITINCEHETVDTNLANTFHFDDTNDTFLYLIYGKNRIQVNGECQIEFLLQYKYEG